MSMHLEGPWLSTTGKRKGKKKWASAEAKREALRLEQEWNELKKRHGAEQEQRRRARAATAEVYVSPAKTHRGADQPKISSRDTGWVPCTKGADKVYTGDKIIGIGTMHKSNAVPIFSDEQAIDISKMRR
jgi:hypothetical protein